MTQLISIYIADGWLRIRQSLRVISAMAAIACVSSAVATEAATLDPAQLVAKDPAMSIEHLYRQCSGTDVWQQWFCAGFISATMEQMTVIGATDLRHDFGICPKIGVSVNAGVQVFKNWAEKNPEVWGIQRYMGVTWAFKEAWPCDQTHKDISLETR
jgi:hypothetical protein